MNKSEYSGDEIFYFKIKNYFNKVTPEYDEDYNYNEDHEKDDIHYTEFTLCKFRPKTY